MTITDVPQTTCTGVRYAVNPDAPDEGSDIAHDGPCPVHPQLLAETIIVALPFGADSIDDLDVNDAEVSAEMERVDIGGAGPLHGRYLRVEATDLVDVAQALHRLADRIMDVTFDAREDALEATRHDCWCGTRLEADEITCGAARCNWAELLNEDGRL